MLTDPNMTIPKRGKIFSINEGYAQYWDDSTTKYIEQCKKPEVQSHCDLLCTCIMNGPIAQCGVFHV